MPGPGDNFNALGDIFRLLPNLPGLLQQNQAQPQPQQAPPAPGGAGRLFGVPAGPNQQRSTGNALIAAGTSLADDQGSFIGGVGRAVGAGQAAAIAGAEQEKLDALQARMADLASRGELVPMFFQALASGDDKTAQTIGTFLNASRRTGSQQGLINVSPGSRIFDPATGEEVFSNPAAPKRPPGLGTPQKIIGADGTPALAAWDSQRGVFVETGAKPPPSESAQQMGLFATGLEQANVQIDALAENGFSGPNIWEQIVFDFPPGLVRNSLQGFLSDDAQAFNTSTQRYLEFFLRPVTGARIADEEVRRGQFLFIPLPGDSNSTILLKKRNRQSFTNAMQVRAQRLGVGQVPEYETTKQAFDDVFGVDNEFAVPTGGATSFGATEAKDLTEEEASRGNDRFRN